MHEQECAFLTCPVRNDIGNSGERARLACWRWCPRHRELCIEVRWNALSSTRWQWHISLCSGLICAFGDFVSHRLRRSRSTCIRVSVML